MATIQSLHALWQSYNSYFKNQGTTWQQNTWWGYTPPLAINADVAFSQTLAPIWMEALEVVLNEGFEYVSQCEHPDDAKPNEGFDGWKCAEKVLDNMGLKAVAEPSNQDKSQAKHERYKHHIFNVRQLWLSAYNSEYELSKKPWQATSFLYKPERQTAAALREAIAKRLDVPQRTGAIWDECARVAKKLGFASISAASVVPNENILEVLSEIEASANALHEKFGVPHTAAGFNGVNLMVNPPAKHMGQRISYNNSIVVTTSPHKKYASSFWHEWTHMLEDRTFLASNMKVTDHAWNVYKHMAPILRELHKGLRTLPKGDVASEPVFNADPFYSLRQTVKNLATNETFVSDVNTSLLHEFETGVALHADYSFAHVMEKRANHKHDPQGLCVLFQSWRPAGAPHIQGFTDEYTNEDGYDEKSKMLVSYTKALRDKKSQYMANAIALDHGAHGEYWSASHELLARATQSYFDAVGIADNSYDKQTAMTQKETENIAPFFNNLFEQLKMDFAPSDFRSKLQTKRENLLTTPPTSLGFRTDNN